MISFEEFLAEEWKPALGCTEPASIAYAAALAACQSDGPIRSVHVRCDPRIYKNCYAVGIPHSGHKVGILWALAIGSLLPDPTAKLEVFRQITPDILSESARLIEENGCEGAMIGRGMFGNPWVFAGRKSEDTPLAEKLAALIELAHGFERLSPPKSFAILKKHTKAFATGFDGAAHLRAQLMEAESADELEAVIAQYAPHG